MNSDLLLAGAIGSLLIVAYALLCVSKWDWETLPRLVMRMLKMMRWEESDQGVTVTELCAWVRVRVGREDEKE